MKPSSRPEAAYFAAAVEAPPAFRLCRCLFSSASPTHSVIPTEAKRSGGNPVFCRVPGASSFAVSSRRVGW